MLFFEYINLLDSTSIDPLLLHSFPTRRSSDLRDPTPAGVGDLGPGVAVRDHAPARRSHQLVRLRPRASHRVTDRGSRPSAGGAGGSEEHTSELQSRGHLVCRLLLG